MRKVKVSLGSTILTVKVQPLFITVFDFAVSLIEEAVKQNKAEFLDVSLRGLDDKNPNREVELKEKLHPILRDRTVVKISRSRSLEPGKYFPKYHQRIPLRRRVVNFLLGDEDSPKKRTEDPLNWADRQGYSGLISIFKTDSVFTQFCWEYNQDIFSWIIKPEVRTAIKTAIKTGSESAVKVILEVLDSHREMLRISPQEYKNEYDRLGKEIKDKVCEPDSALTATARYNFFEKSEKFKPIFLAERHSQFEMLEELFFLYQNEENESNNLEALFQFSVSAYKNRKQETPLKLCMESGSLFSIYRNRVDTFAQICSIAERREWHKRYYLMPLAQALLPRLACLLMNFFPSVIVDTIKKYCDEKEFILSISKLERERYLHPLVELTSNIQENQPGNKDINASVIRNILDCIGKTNYFLEEAVKKQLTFHLKQYAYQGYTINTSSLYYAAFIKLLGKDQVNTIFKLSTERSTLASSVGLMPPAQPQPELSICTSSGKNRFSLA